MARINPQASLNKTALIASAVTVGLSVTSFLVEISPHSFFLKKYQSILARYSLGEQEPLDEKTKSLFNAVLDDLQMKESQRKKLTPFSMTGFSTYQAGMSTTRFGAIIGIPINYTYKDKTSINAYDIRLGLDQEPLNVYHPAAEDLLNSLVLSDKAKKFGIAREILMSEKEIPLYRALESPVIISATAFASEFARVKLKLNSKPIILSVIIYVTNGLLAFSTWFQIRDSLWTYYEKNVDEQLASIGPDYVEGGKEFYEKQIKRNIALRTLMGPDGSKHYNKDGDEIFWIRNKRTSLTHRKKFFAEYTIQENEAVC